MRVLIVSVALLLIGLVGSGTLNISAEQPTQPISERPASHRVWVSDTIQKTELVDGVDCYDMPGYTGKFSCLPRTLR